MSVRVAQLEDLPAFLRLMLELNPEDPILEPMQVESIWRQLLATALVLVKELDGVLVATCTLVLVPNLSRGARSYGLIENVVTLVAYRGQGYGRAVLQAALSEAWRRSCYKVMLSTSARTAGVLDFYRRCGFKDGVKVGFVAIPD
ncbi:GNAT family N-acetyltransferase [Chitinibacter fontanus]|uniref:GNAT family N-acetyltransferase n=1 Tax=Chitinibacter fontanus TaxID=1737446 RepID=A0A7D5Z5U2_9NEIS|nr:GNAT family N-acetyltransferase [Chitinibacter fontanus]QLI82581.1 GNAT family N-acetyltransferase [Chitinibacter fontanus]